MQRYVKNNRYNLKQDNFKLAFEASICKADIFPKNSVELSANRDVTSLCTIKLNILMCNYVYINLFYPCIGIHNTKMYESAYKLMAKQVCI
jgi:hypothetical protein